MGKQAAPFARVPIGRRELQMMARIGFMSAGEREPKVLPALGELRRRVRLGCAEIVHPKDAALASLERAGLGIRRGGKQVPHEFRHGPNFQCFTLGKRDRVGVSEPGRHPLVFATINCRMVPVRAPLRPRRADDCLKRPVPAKFSAGRPQQRADPPDFGQGQRFDLPRE